jgi:hypothetical protein
MTELAVVTTITVALITAVIGPVVIEWVKVKFRRKEEKISSVKEAIDLNELVDTQLDQLMERLHCDRIWIAQFHNGGHFYPTGKSIQKFSIFYEKLAPSIPPIQHVFQQIPVSLFPKAFSKLYKESELVMSDYSLHEEFDLEIFYSGYGTKSFYLIALNDLDGHFIGIMGISYNNKEYKMTKDEWNFVKNKTGAIGSLLTGYLYNKKQI